MFRLFVPTIYQIPHDLLRNTPVGRYIVFDLKVVPKITSAVDLILVT